MSVEISKSASETEVVAEQVFDYYITLENLNTVDATVLTITDQLPTNFTLTEVSLKIGAGADTTLVATDYTLSSGNLFTLPSSTGPFITVPAGETTRVTLTGYFN